jgi:copper transport protein
MSRLHRPAVASAAAAGLALYLLLLAPAAVLAHSQLVSSEPGAGSTVATSPPQILLVFSEPVDPAYTSLDVLDSVGHVIEEDVGAPLPSDARQFVAPLPPLSDGAYTVSWRAISAADGHSTSGFVTFAVGNATLPAGAATSGQIDPHAGHGGVALVVEVVGRTVGSLGFMAAFGLAIFVWLAQIVVPQIRRRLALLALLGLLLGTIGAVLLGWTATQTGLVGAANANLLVYLATARSGQLLLLRAGVGAVGALIGAVLLWRGRNALVAAWVGGGLGLLLIAWSSHAAAFTTPVPLLAQAIHLAAASAWVGGLLGLGAMVLARLALPNLQELVPRFSAAALVSVALIAATGAYLDWVQTGDPISLASQYQVVLAIKIVLFLVALSVGAINYLRGARAIDGRTGFRTRVLVETGLAGAVIAASGVLASGIPPSGLLPLQIASATTSAVSVLDAQLALSPGRAGPNQFTVTGASVPTNDQLVLILQRLDQDIGTSRIPLQASADGSWIATGVPLPSDTRWDATVALDASDQSEVSRARFVFGVGPDGLTEGEASPFIDPGVLLGALLLLGSILGVVFVLAGGRLPRTDPRASRLAVFIGSAAAVVLGLALLWGGVVR